MGFFSKIFDDVLGLDPNGGGIYNTARNVLGDTVADDWLGMDPNGGGAIKAWNVALPALAGYGMYSGLSGMSGLGGGGGAGAAGAGTTGAGMASLAGTPELAALMGSSAVPASQLGMGVGMAGGASGIGAAGAGAAGVGSLLGGNSGGSMMDFIKSVVGSTGVPGATGAVGSVGSGVSPLAALLGNYNNYQQQQELKDYTTAIQQQQADIQNNMVSGLQGDISKNVQPVLQQLSQLFTQDSPYAKQLEENLQRQAAARGTRYDSAGRMQALQADIASRNAPLLAQNANIASQNAYSVANAREQAGKMSLAQQLQMNELLNKRMGLQNQMVNNNINPDTLSMYGKAFGNISSGLSGLFGNNSSPSQYNYNSSDPFNVSDIFSNWNTGGGGG